MHNKFAIGYGYDAVNGVNKANIVAIEKADICHISAPVKIEPSNGSIPAFALRVRLKSSKSEHPECVYFSTIEEAREWSDKVLKEINIEVYPPVTSTSPESEFVVIGYGSPAGSNRGVDEDNPIVVDRRFIAKIGDVSYSDCGRYYGFNVSTVVGNTLYGYYGKFNTKSQAYAVHNELCQYVLNTKSMVR